MQHTQQGRMYRETECAFRVGMVVILGRKEINMMFEYIVNVLKEDTNIWAMEKVSRVSISS